MQIRDLIPWGRRADHPGASGTAPLVALQQDINHLFDGLRGRIGAIEWPWGAGDARSDMVETADNAIEVTVELPGMDRDDLEVLVGNGVLTVRGEKRVERQDEKKGYYLSERSYGSVFRTIPLPPGVDADRAEASFRNGVLTIRIPQTPEARAKARRVEIKAA